MEQHELISYNEKFADSILAQGQGKHFVRLLKLPDLYQRADGIKTRYQLDYRELSCTCEHEDDEAYVCVWISANTYWTPTELLNMGINVRKKVGNQVPEGFNIFEHISIL